MHIERLAEVTTGEPRWMQRIESLGYKPEVINVYKGGGEIRLYSLPKRHILLPSKGATIPKADLNEAKRIWARRVEWERETDKEVGVTRP